MAFRDMMANDLVGTALNPNELGQAVLLIPADQQGDGGLGIAVTLLFGDDRQQFMLTDQTGPVDNFRTSAVGSRTAMRAAIQQLTGTTRDPNRQDEIAIAPGDPFEGTWVIERATPDQGDGMSLDLRLDRPYAITAAGVRQG